MQSRCHQQYILLVASTALAVLALMAYGVEGPGRANLEPKAALATIVVATADSSDRSKAAADFVADGHADQEEIIQALRALPKVGGTVLLMEGTYDIRKVEGTYGGITVDRSDVTLAGQGSGTRLVLAPGQNTNVIRIVGSGVGNTTIRDLLVDQNRDENPYGDGRPAVSHERFEYCGIKAYHGWPGQTHGTLVHDVTIANCRVINARRLNIMLDGIRMKVLDNYLGNATSDSVEILRGPGLIRGNYVEITGQTNVAIGTDRANDVVIQNNIVHVRRGGRLVTAYRTWDGSTANVLSSNLLTVDEGGQCLEAMYIRGNGAIVTGNNIRTRDPSGRMRLTVSGGNTVLANNVIENTAILLDDQTGLDLPIVVHSNVLFQSSIQHVRGRLFDRDHHESVTIFGQPLQLSH